MKTAIVTGVAGGIGKASAIMLAERGYAVVGMGRSETPDLSDFDGLDVTYVPGDISSSEHRARLFDTAREKGDITALVNVAGVAPKVRSDILEMTEESYDYVMGINTKGTLFLTQTVANHMIKQGKGGSIVNISSCSAYTSS
ncbi:MAG: SDR family NAD(P)-dependent oxidoreductase, partial [Clostridia bacterium]|nr:SDR family NAD(P)-dependent oxidoreductase [Clostridia bacterium]